jgi:glutamate synthase (NADPH/NADH) large chain
MISDRYILAASEVGICPSVEAGAYKTAQLEPGQTIRYRIENDELLDEQEVIEKLSEKNPYKEWVKNKPLVADTEFSDKPDDIKIDSFSEYFQYTPEEERLILLPMIKGDIPTGSMGNDSPLAVLSNNKPRLSRYFHQMFAQVTNPPIDPIRERFVMSTKTYLGKRGSILKETSQQANLITLESPILSKGTYDLLVSKEFSKDRSKVFDVSFNKADKNLEQFIDELCDEIYEAVINKKSLIILSDREVVKGNTIAPSLLVLGRVHQHLINKGVRLKASLIIVSGEIRDAHDLACHIAYGASAIWPYLALEKARQLSIENEELNISPSQAQENYREALNKGLLKIMSKMGICTVSSYRGSEIYEIIGLDKEITDSAFSNSFTRTEGLGYKQIEDNLLVFDSDEPFDLEIGGFYKHKKGSEPHVTSPVTVLKLQKAVRSGDRDEWNKYLESLEERDNVQIRDLFTLPDNNKIITSNDKDIPLEDIYKKFTVSSMSLGALSEEAHQALAIAMNRIGAKSGSGEGGEDPERYGTEKNSKIKQIASGRFGVTPDYLASAEEFQIKMAQGSKPGEGGQLPGFKVDTHIAKLRHTVEGITLISPPPHHDIYSIEDLAQLIYDLKTFNPDNPVNVKLVSEPGVGVIAVGVAKAGADVITIAGSDGGTGASPWTSIKHAGSPWELGLSETHQALVENNMRDKVLLEVDGGLRSPKDVIIATLLGADRYGFGTLPLLALGCKMVRQCHENTCPVGIATQDENLRAKFVGAPEQVMQLFKFIAEDIKSYLDIFNVSSLNDLIGHADLLGLKVMDNNLPKSLHKLLRNAVSDKKNPGFIRHDEGRLSRRLTSEIMKGLKSQESTIIQYPISNEDRSIGARISGEVSMQNLGKELKTNPTYISLSGAAGQSFGAFIRDGINLKLIGSANDYVGKGMGGGSITIIPQGTKNKGAYHAAGNALLYGATGGQLYISGRVGQRFGVRNSGGIAVVEGCSAHAAEYMTGGTLIILGSIGFNFGAGMTGGKVTVLKTQKNFTQYISKSAPEYRDMNDIDTLELRAFLNKHIEQTDSELAKDILKKEKDWSKMFAVFGGIANVTEQDINRAQETIEALD